MKKEKHIFAICAYKESPYLEECIRSLKDQTIKSNIIMITSTNNAYINACAKKWNIPLFVNEGEGGITQDWNFAYKMANASYVTIAHQDDVYEKEYLANAMHILQDSVRPLIYFTDYGEIREGKKVEKNTLLRVKRIMLFPLQIKKLQKYKWIRRRILSLGSPICCPSVTYAKNNLPKTIFKNGFRSCEDWEAWEMLSKLDGEFLYDKRILMYHRIHEGSETSAIIGDNARSEEEYVMFCKFWPKWFAKILEKQYSKGQKSNKL